MKTDQDMNFFDGTSVVFVCSRVEWGSENATISSFSLKLPDLWENVKFQIEQKMGFHHVNSFKKSTVRLEGRLVNIFDNPESHTPESFPLLKAKDEILEESVIIVSRIPVSKGTGHMVPVGCRALWRTWLESVNFINSKKRSRYGDQTTKKQLVLETSFILLDR